MEYRNKAPSHVMSVLEVPDGPDKASRRCGVTQQPLRPPAEANLMIYLICESNFLRTDQLQHVQI